MNPVEAQGHWWSGGERRFTRRSLLKGVAVGGLGLAAGAVLGCEDKSKRDPTHIFTGNVEILRSDKLNVRTSPRRPELGSGNNNIVPWSHIISINGVKLEGVEAISIQNPGIVYGKDPTGRKERSAWIQVLAEIKGSGLNPTQFKHLYINLSNTQPYVNPDIYGNIIPVTKKDSEYITGMQGQGGVELVAYQVGKVTVVAQRDK